MSYLIMADSPLGDLGSATISFWVKCKANQGAEETISKDWLPPSLDTLFGNGIAAYPGASYHWVSNGLGLPLQPPHIWCYPFPGPHNFIDLPGDGPTSWKDGLVPFITFGDPNLPFDRVNWVKEGLNSVWIFGRGGVPQSLISQYPELAGREIGIVPPSCIGADKNGNLRVILQTGDKATYTGCAWAQSKSKTIHIMTPVSTIGGSVPTGWVDFSTRQNIQPNQWTGFNFYYEDVSMLECAQHPEAFIMDSDVMIADGKWHHVVLSFSIRGPIEAKSTGPDGDRPALPGTWGQYSGVDGEYALAPIRCITNFSNPSYAELACYGAPFEEMGKYSYATGGTITSGARAWLAVDGKSLKRKQLNHKQAWEACENRPGGKDALANLDDHAIVPPNALLIPGAEIRTDMSTNLTGWERDYRTLLGAFTGPACRIDVTTEPRRLDYVRPSYRFTSGPLPVKGHPIAIPGGPKQLWGKHDRNYDIIVAELQIWPGRIVNTDQNDNIGLFIKKGRPQDIDVAEEKLLKPAIRMHWATNWLEGINTGTLGRRKTGAGSGADPKKYIMKGNFEPVGKIKRWLEDKS